MLRSKQRREMHSSIKKTWILDKAGALFWQKGYHGTSMRDIANTCKCKPANIYNYFNGKEDILFEAVRDITEQTVSAIRHLGDDEITNPVDQIKSLIKIHFKFWVSMKRSSVLLSDTGLKDLTTEHRKEVIKLRDEYESIIRRIIRRGVERGYFTDKKDDKVVAYLISSMIIRSSLWFSPKGRLSADEVGDIMFDFVWRGLKSEGTR